MKEGKDIITLARKIARQAESKVDYTADTGALRVDVAERVVEPATEQRNAVVKAEPVLVFKSNGGEPQRLPLTETAHGQVAARHQVPLPFYNRLRTEHPDLLAPMLTGLMHREPQRRMLRTLDGHVRAYLSDEYRPLDNVDLFEAVFPSLRDLGVQVVSTEVTESRMYIKFLCPGVKVDAPDLMPPNRRDPHGDALTPGATVRRGEFAGFRLSEIVAGGCITNSEVGLGTLKVQNLRFFVRCLNGWIDATVVRQTHVGRSTGIEGLDASEFYRDSTRALDDAALFSKVRDTLQATLRIESLQAWVDTARAARADEVPAVLVPSVVEVVGKQLRLGEGERGKLLASMIEDGDLSRWGLSNAITRIAQSVESYDQATDLEQAGSHVINLPRNAWHSIMRDAERITADAARR